MKRRLFVCFLALTMLLSLTACGAASKTAASVDSSANDHPAESPAVTEEKGYFDADTNGYDDEGRDSGGGVLENQKIIYTGTLNLEPRSLTRPSRRWQHWRRSRAAIWRAAP